MVKPLWERAVDLEIARLTHFQNTMTHSVYGPYGVEDGCRINKQTHDALAIAAYVSGWGEVTYTQGGINGGAVTQSADTHAGLDVADVMTRGRSKNAIFSFAEVAMDCGMAPFIRGSDLDNIDDRMVPHFHFVRIGAQHAHPSARAQIYNPTYGYAFGGGGLAGAPSVRFWGPEREILVEWKDSVYNPKNGWRP